MTSNMFDFIDSLGQISDIKAKRVNVSCAPCHWGVIALGAKEPVIPTYVPALLSLQQRLKKLFNQWLTDILPNI